jgi:hypothetical protein
VRITLAVLVGAALTGCAAQQPLMKQTVSGNAEVFIPFVEPDEVREKLVGACAQLGAAATSSTNTVVCRMQMQGTKAALMQTLIANSYSTTPDDVAYFTFAWQERGTFLTLYRNVETQMAMGQVRAQKLTGSNVQNENQAALNAILESLDPRPAE